MSETLRPIDGNGHVPAEPNPAIALGLEIGQCFARIEAKLDQILARVGGHTAAVELGHQMGYAQAVLDRYGITTEEIARENA